MWRRQWRAGEARLYVTDAVQGGGELTDRTVKGATAKTANKTDPVDVPEADVAEQRRDAFDEDEDTPSADEAPLDVDPADAAEQRIVVELDDDEYR